MAKYLLEASYTAAGAKGLLKEGGSSRRKVVDELVASLGGKVEAFYFAFGASDAVVILDLPDHVTAAAASVAVSASGAVTTKTTVLLTPQELDQAAKKSVNYRAPGQ